MQEYAKKTSLASFSDRLLGRLLTMLVGVGWFVALWGLRLSSLTAGLAFGAMLLMCVESFRRGATRKREKLLRQKLGGELALEKLLTEEERRAAFRAAMWLTEAAKPELIRTTQRGVLCRIEDRLTLIRVLALHPSMTAEVQRLVELRKEALAAKADACVVCLTCMASREAQAYAETGSPTLKLIERNELIALAGRYHPATDEQLRELGRRKRSHAPMERWLRHILARKRAKRYFCYGLGMAALYLFTGAPYYPMPSVVCIGLCVGCLLYKPRKGRTFFS